MNALADLIGQQISIIISNSTGSNGYSDFFANRYNDLQYTIFPNNFITIISTEFEKIFTNKVDEIFSESSESDKLLKVKVIFHQNIGVAPEQGKFNEFNYKI